MLRRGSITCIDYRLPEAPQFLALSSYRRAHQSRPGVAASANSAALNRLARRGICRVVALPRRAVINQALPITSTPGCLVITVRMTQCTPGT